MTHQHRRVWGVATVLWALAWSGGVLAARGEAGASSAVMPVARTIGKLPGGPAALSPDGQSIAVVQGNAVLLVRLADGQIVRRLTGHSGSVPGVVFSPDGTRIATGSYDDTVRLWDLQTGKEIRRLADAGADFEAIDCSPDGTLVAALNDDKNLWYLSTEGGAPKKLPLETSNYQARLAFSPDGTTIVSIGAGALCFCDAKTPRLRTKLEVTDSRLVFSPKGDLLATYGSGSKITLRSASNGSVVRELTGHDRSVVCAAFAPSGAYLISAADDETEAIVWNVSTGEATLRLPHSEEIGWVAFAPDGRLVYTNSDALWAWDVTGLEDPAKRAVLTAYCDGEKDRYSRFIRMVLAPETGPVVRYPDQKAGHVLTTIVRRSGLAVEAVEVRLGGQSVSSSISVETSRGSSDVDPRRLRSIRVGRVDEKTARVSLSFQDATTDQGTMPAGEGTVRGRSVLGDFSDDLGEIASLSFDFRYADRESEQPASPPDRPFRAEVLDVEGGRLAAGDVKTSTSGSGHVLPIYLDGLAAKIDFRHLREVDVLLAPKGGLIAKVTLSKGQELFGFISASQVYSIQGNVAFGTFKLNLRDLKAIRFH